MSSVRENTLKGLVIRNYSVFTSYQTERMSHVQYFWYTHCFRMKSPPSDIFSCVICNIAHYNILNDIMVSSTATSTRKDPHWAALQLGESSHLCNWAHRMGGQWCQPVTYNILTAQLKFFKKKQNKNSFFWSSQTAYTWWNVFIHSLFQLLLN